MAGSDLSPRMFRLCAALALLSSCVTTISNQSARETMFASLSKRASFELGCSVDPADITLIAQTEYGVEKCGCRATYLSTSAGWVLNSASGEKCAVTK